MQPFDWYRIFIGDLSLLFTLEIVFRTAFMYLFTVLMARLIGKRGMAQITPFEFIVVIVLGSATGDPMLYPNVPLIHGMAIVTTIVVLEQGYAYISQKSEKIEEYVESSPTLIIKKGQILKGTLEEVSFSKENLMMQLRQQGITDLGYVKEAYLEPSGKLSVFKYKKAPKLVRKTKPQHTNG
ncbi:DUF421 domain-containing protein [Candidatus Roizmanbacteria bacterium]|nr:MAG: DUF421 domain-containing protein [Candidatus Roizmanbacteria bacterium]